MHDKIQNIFHSQKFFTAVFIVFLSLYMLIGLSSFQDYNVSVDEPIQREHSRVAYKYINEKLLHRQIASLADLPDLQEYEHKYYGVAIQMPLMLAEDLFHFDLSPRRIFQGRHLYNFLICTAGYICFFLALVKIFKNKWYAFAGMLFISLYPRFYACQYYDIKNMIFAALNMVTLLTLVNVAERCNITNILLFALAAAITTNQRIMGVLFPAVLIGYFAITDIVGKRKERGILILRKYVLVLFFYLLFWFAVTPAAWVSPIRTFYETFAGFSHYEKWNGTMHFNGRLVTCEERPWYYLFVWFGITIPVWQIALFAAGHVYAAVCIWESRRRPADLVGKHKWLACSLALFWGSVGAVIILNARIYETWRHMYFVFVPFCCICVYGLRFLAEKTGRYAAGAAVAVCLTVQVGWMVYNHPYQDVYFNAIGRKYATEFDRDTWHMSNLEMLKWIARNDDDDQITVQGYFLETAELVMDDTDTARIRIVPDDAEYIVANYTAVSGNTLSYEGYGEVYTVWTDNYKLGSVFRRLEQ